PQNGSSRGVVMIVETGDLARRVEPRDRRPRGREHPGKTVRAHTAKREGDRASERIAYERRPLDRECPVRFGRDEAPGGLAVERARIEFARPDGRVVICHGALERPWIEAECCGELAERRAGHRRLIREDDRLHGLDRGGGLIPDEEHLLALMTPDLERELLEGGIEAILALVVETLGACI